MTTDWTQAEINALMNERDAAIDDAEAARMLWRKSEGACALMHAERDAAQQMVADLRGALADIADSEAKHNGSQRSAQWMADRAWDALDRARKLLDQP
jgi:hypothetical protein